MGITMDTAFENPEFLTSQIITYIGNKRTLIYDIESQIKEIKSVLKKEKLVCADLFSGSGIVSRMLKSHSSRLIVNDLENYSFIINSCYLTNKEDFSREKYADFRKKILSEAEKTPQEGIISQNYAPKDDRNIQKDERAFYTRQNALLIDTYRALIEDIADEKYRRFFLAPLITEASVHVNTSGVFKGFYKDSTTGIGCFGGKGKNALSRIEGIIQLKEPVFSNFSCQCEIHQKDTILLAEKLSGIDMTYLDPPYNQHPYGSNYFMLNLIAKNKIDAETSRVSGIPNNWNRSLFNKKAAALSSLEKIIQTIDSKFIIISYNSEGFISFDEMERMLESYGPLKTVEIKYNTFRGSRNLKNRSIHVSEYLFILEKQR